ncbi:LacI family DNA-binding transcriptional regulator, partial [Nocardiopsis quinghaiensis]|uniref:LacI family DNA-binding transcriptional regulator n=1 Tax=Nocardiopsis quinghaiensis TaxID=464995 RepID=UPI001CC23F67
MTEVRRAGTRRRPRQSDIARMAGVSQATVSLILRGTPAGMALARETRQRVLRAAEELGYVPDPVATRLASASNAMLGLYTFSTTFPTDVAHSYYPILVGVEEEAAAQGQDLILFTGSARAAARADDPAAVGGGGAPPPPPGGGPPPPPAPHRPPPPG